MNTTDLRILCTALGFTVVVLKGGEGQPDSAGRALSFAGLIEAFCCNAIPNIGAAVNENDRLDQSIDQLKAALRAKDGGDFNANRQTLLRLFDRLCQRRVTLRGDKMVAHYILETLNSELKQAMAERYDQRR